MSNFFSGKVGRMSLQCEIPDFCPVCHRHVALEETELLSGSSMDRLQAVYKCPSRSCLELFIVTYASDGSRAFIYDTSPVRPAPPKISERVKRISPRFTVVYSEAESARATGLNEIAGPGYRKAFEILIKDYAISRICPAVEGKDDEPSKEDAEKIEDVLKSFSGEVVRKFIDDSRLNKLSKRVLWLGNDETHYLRRWVEKDLTDLRTLLQLAINDIDNQLLADEYLTDMEDKT